MIIYVANGALEAGDDDGTACHKANGVVKKNRIKEALETLLYQKASAMIEAVQMQVVAELFEAASKDGLFKRKCNGPNCDVITKHEATYSDDDKPILRCTNCGLETPRKVKTVKESMEGEPEGVLSKHGWKVAGKAGDNTHYVHPEKKGQIHVSRNGNWRHYDQNGECLQAGFTGEKLRKHLGESVLNEADPRPRVERDHKGRPVVPTRQHYLNYFQDMHHEHVKAALHDARNRWDAAAKEADDAKAAHSQQHNASSEERHRLAQAHLKALGHEMAVGKSVLKSKRAKLNQANKKTFKKAKQHHKTVQGVTKGVAKAVLGKTPLATFLGKHIANRFAPQPKQA